MSNIRWGKTLLAAIAVEIVLMIPTIIIFSTLGEVEAQALLDMLIPPLALLVFIPAGLWVARGSPAPVLNGVIAGSWGIVLYVALTLVMRGAVADFDFESSLRPAYLLAHALKVVGGGIGGWLAARKAAG